MYRFQWAKRVRRVGKWLPWKLPVPIPPSSFNMHNTDRNRAYRRANCERAYYHIHIEIATGGDLFLINKLREGMSPITTQRGHEGRFGLKNKPLHVLRGGWNNYAKVAPISACGKSWIPGTVSDRYHFCPSLLFSNVTSWRRLPYWA